jgi:hypothetical protein
MEVLKRRDFARWRRGEALPDAALCEAALEMELGLLGVDLGGLLYKKRVARPGGGKRGGYRTLLAFGRGDRYVFLHGFSKNSRENITGEEKRALQFAGRVFLALAGSELASALQNGVLLEVRCDEQTH